MLLIYFLSSIVCFLAADAVGSLTLDLKSCHSQTLLDQLITSTPSWPLTSGPSDCTESYLNLLNLENGAKPEASANGELESLVTSNGKAEDKEGSCRDLVPLMLRNSANVDEK